MYSLSFKRAPDTNVCRFRRSAALRTAALRTAALRSAALRTAALRSAAKWAGLIFFAKDKWRLVHGIGSQRICICRILKSVDHLLHRHAHELAAGLDPADHFVLRPDLDEEIFNGNLAVTQATASLTSMNAGLLESIPVFYPHTFPATTSMHGESITNR